MKPHWFALPALAVVFLIAGLWLLEPSDRAAVQVPRPVAELPSSGWKAPQSVGPLSLAASMPLKLPDAVEGTKPLAESSLPQAVTVQREVGSCKQTYQAYTISEPLAGEAKVVALSKGARANGQLNILIGELTGSTPEIGALGHLVDDCGVTLAEVKVLRRYHVDDDDSLPIEEVGALATNANAECQTGQRVVWGGEREVLHGFWRAWYEDGTRACEGTFEHGKRSGAWWYWHRNGELRARGSFKDGLPEGEWNWWYDSGARHARSEFKASPEWSVWDEAGDVDPFHDPGLLAELEPILKDYRKGNYDAAAEALDAITKRDAKADIYRALQLQEALERWLAGLRDDSGNPERDGYDLFTELTVQVRPTLPPPVYAPEK